MYLLAVDNNLFDNEYFKLLRHLLFSVQLNATNMTTQQGLPRQSNTTAAMLVLLVYSIKIPRSRVPSYNTKIVTLYNRVLPGAFLSTETQDDRRMVA